MADGSSVAQALTIAFPFAVHKLAFCATRTAKLHFSVRGLLRGSRVCGHNLTSGDARARLVAQEFRIQGPCKWLVNSPPLAAPPLNVHWKRGGIDLMECLSPNASYLAG